MLRLAISHALKQRIVTIHNHIKLIEGTPFGLHVLYRRRKPFDVRKSVHHHTTQINQPTRCNSFTSQVYCLTFMCGSTCFEGPSAHHQERTTALGASGFTVGEWRMERCWSWSARPRPTTLQPPS
jgi:hypothetical protein